MPLVAPCATLIASLAWLMFWLAYRRLGLGTRGVVDRQARRIDGRTRQPISAGSLIRRLRQLLLVVGQRVERRPVLIDMGPLRYPLEYVSSARAASPGGLTLRNSEPGQIKVCAQFRVERPLEPATEPAPGRGPNRRSR